MVHLGTCPTCCGRRWRQGGSMRITDMERCRVMSYSASGDVRSSRCGGSETSVHSSVCVAGSVWAMGSARIGSACAASKARATGLAHSGGSTSGKVYVSGRDTPGLPCRLAPPSPATLCQSYCTAQWTYCHLTDLTQCTPQSPVN
jgi:hypothetical protein